MKNFRIYAKVLHHDGEEFEKDESLPEDMIKGFSLIKTVKDEKFEKRNETKRYALDGNRKQLIVSEIKLIIDETKGGKGSGV